MALNAWIFLAIAIAFEVCGTILLKLSNGFEKLAYGMMAIGCYTVCFWFFVTLISVVFMGDRLEAGQYGFIGLIVVGAVGLNLTSHA